MIRERAAPASERRWSAIDIAFALLLVLGTARLFALVLHDPLLGYANQYDMARTSACVDLWPSLPVPERYGPHQASPVPYYVVDAGVGGCYRSTAAVFVASAKALTVVAQAAGVVARDRFPLRAVGVVQALALTALVLAFCRAERARPWARLAHAAVFSLVLADPANTLWLNTLYTEFATLLCAYAVAGVLALATITRPTPLCATSAVVALAGLALSRQQYLPFAVVPLLMLAPYWLRRARAAWLAALVGVATVGWIQTNSLASIPTIRSANNYDFYLGAVLPAVRDEARALSLLGLPPQCRSAIGATWYIGMGAAPRAQCPEVSTLGRHEFARLVVDDPLLMWRVLLRGLPEAQAWWQHHLGMVAGETLGHLPSRSTWLGVSLADASERLPLPAYLFVLAAMAGAWLVASLAWTRAALRQAGDDGWLRCIVVVSTLGLYAHVSAIFGDGHVDVARHAMLWHSAVATLVLLGIGRALARRDDRVRLLKGVLATAAIAGIFTVALYAAARHWPLARGVIDEPATRQFSGERYVMRGWALDPFEVATVRIALYDDWDAATARGEWTGVATQPKQGPFGESLQRYYPTYAGSQRGGFSIEIPRAALTSGARCLRTRVQNRLGVITEIDRRCLQP